MGKKFFKAAFCALLIFGVLIPFSGCATKSGMVGEGRVDKSMDKEYLIQVLMTNESPYARRDAAETLGSMPDPMVIGALIGVLGDNDAVVRDSAREALVNIGEPAIESLIAALEEGNLNVGENAARALGEIGDLRAVDPLIAALSGRNIGAARGAAWALGELGDKRAVEALIEARKQGDEDLRWAAAEAMDKMLGGAEISIKKD